MNWTSHRAFGWSEITIQTSKRCKISDSSFECENAGSPCFYRVGMGAKLDFGALNGFGKRR
jgi:hypothetical protein